MNISELGAIGEIVGALGVIASLIYLSVQIRQNTHAMDEGRRLALAQTYQMRADALQQMVVTAANSEIGAIIVKLTEDGYPRDVSALDRLSAEERGRFRLWQIAQQTHWDNLHFQYQQGFLDDEYFNDSFKERTVRLAPVWRALGITGGRRSFLEEIERLEKLADKV
ncbi:MAG: hypothetical protein V2I74_07805 [Erythrobacter sp.]|jgi:hypothetical protein|nr:hypothetical protein [Erythrobacter sp.]